MLIVSDELLEKINKPYLSASTSKAMHSCPAHLVVDRALPRGFDLFGAAELGTAAHTVLERLYVLPPGRRDNQHAMAILTELAREAPHYEGDVDYAKALGADPVRHTQWIASVSAGFSGIFKIEDPVDVVVHSTELLLDGIEVAGVPFKGFIDRVDELPDEELSIVDYKTGRDLSRPNPMWDDDHGDQIRLYVEAATVKFERKPKAGFLYYIQHGKKRRVAISNAEVAKTKRAFAESWADLQNAVASREFTTRQSPLCGWCPAVNSCPTAAAAGLTDRKGGAPTAIDLGIPSLRPDGTVIPLVTTGPKWGAQAGPGVPVAADAAHTTCEEEPPEDPDLGDVMSNTESDKAWREAKPYDGSEIDGHLSLNSYAATGVFGLASLAAEVLAKAGQKVGPGSVKALTGVLGALVLNAQGVVTNGSRDWQDGANTRMRGALRTSLDIIPAPFGGDVDAWQKWMDRTTTLMIAVAATAIDLYNNGPVVNLDALASVAAPAAAAA